MDEREVESLEAECKRWLKEKYGTVFTGTEYNLDEMVEAFIEGYKQGYSEAY